MPYTKPLILPVKDFLAGVRNGTITAAPVRPEDVRKSGDQIWVNGMYVVNGKTVPVQVCLSRAYIDQGVTPLLALDAMEESRRIREIAAKNGREGWDIKPRQDPDDEKKKMKPTFGFRRFPFAVKFANPDSARDLNPNSDPPVVFAKNWKNPETEVEYTEGMTVPSELESEVWQLGRVIETFNRQSINQMLTPGTDGKAIFRKTEDYSTTAHYASLNDKVVNVIGWTRQDKMHGRVRIANPPFRVKLPIKKADDSLVGATYNTPLEIKRLSNPGPDGTVEPYTLDEGKTPISNATIHRIIQRGSRIFGILDICTFCFSAMGISHPVSLKTKTLIVEDPAFGGGFDDADENAALEDALGDFVHKKDDGDMAMEGALSGLTSGGPLAGAGAAAAAAAPPAIPATAALPPATAALPPVPAAIPVAAVPAAAPLGHIPAPAAAPVAAAAPPAPVVPSALTAALGTL